MAMVSSCAPTHEFTALENKDFEEAKSRIGTSIKLASIDAGMLCTGFDDGDCHPLSVGQQITVDKAVLTTSGYSYIHAYTSGNVNGYMLWFTFEQLRIHAEYCHEYSPKIGMSGDRVLQSWWCFPESKNTTEIAGHRMEQWVYPHLGYVYLDNGVVTSI